MCEPCSRQLIQLHKSERQVSYKPKQSQAAFRTSTEMPLTMGMYVSSFISFVPQ